MRDAFFELVLYPTKASALVNELYVTAGRNRLYAVQGRASTNDLAAKVSRSLSSDAELSASYNHALAHGKWNHMMDQTHLGYTFWISRLSMSCQQSNKCKSGEGRHGIAIEGSAMPWLTTFHEPPSPDFDVFNRQSHFVDVFIGEGSVRVLCHDGCPMDFR